MFKSFIIYLIYLIFLLFIFINVISSEQTSIKCGDGKCHGEGIETCFNCEADCGKCNFIRFKQCIKPGQFTLTFDDGPTEYTNELLNILKENKIKATFFVLGVQAAKPELAPVLLRALKEGHSIGSHTYNHLKLTECNDQKVIDEIKGAGDQIAKVIGKRPILFRFPYLAADMRTEAILNSLGYIYVDVTADSFDWREKAQNPSQIVKNLHQIIERSNPTKDSLISLQHDTTNPKLYKLLDIIEFVKSKNFEIVNIETCLGLTSIYQSISKPGEKLNSSKLLSEINKDNENKLKSNSTEEFTSKVYNITSDLSKSKASYLTPNLFIIFLLMLIHLKF